MRPLSRRALPCSECKCYPHDMLFPALLLLFHRSQPVDVKLTVDGVQRTAIVYPGSQTSTAPSPVVLVFHGHFGQAELAAAKYRIQDEWPEATVIYPQGLENTSPVVGYGTGWQRQIGGDDDRDLHFVDSLLKWTRDNYKVDSTRVFACGMSNGAVFSLLLLAAKPALITAAASVAGVGGTFLLQDQRPKPVFLINGAADNLVPFKLAEKTRDFFLRLNQCSNTPSAVEGYEVYSGVDRNNVAWHEHGGGHIWPEFATREVVRFFKSVGK